MQSRVSKSSSRGAPFKHTNPSRKAMFRHDPDDLDPMSERLHDLTRTSALASPAAAAVAAAACVGIASKSIRTLIHRDDENKHAYKYTSKPRLKHKKQHAPKHKTSQPIARVTLSPLRPVSQAIHSVPLSVCLNRGVESVCCLIVCMFVCLPLGNNDSNN